LGNTDDMLIIHKTNSQNTQLKTQVSATISELHRAANKFGNVAKAILEKWLLVKSRSN